MIDRATFLQTFAATSLTPFAPPGVVQLTIGVSVPLSGPLAQYGTEIVKGVQAAVDEQNKFSSALHVFGLRAYDDRNDPTIATTNVFTAQADPTVIGMVGNLTNSVTLATLPTYGNSGFALVVPACTADAITSRNYRNIFRLPTKDSSEGQLFARSVLQGRAPMNVLAVSVDGSYGFDVVRAFVQQAQADKHRADDMILNATASPKNAAATMLAKNPQYVFLSGTVAQLGPVAQAMRDQGYTGEIGCSDGFYTTDATQTYATILKDALVASSFPPLDRVPSALSYLPDFRNEVGGITVFSAYGYAAAQLLIQTAQRANATSRISILTQLQIGGSWNLLVGQYAFTYNGDASQPNIYLYRVGANGFTFERPAVPSGFVI